MLSAKSQAPALPNGVYSSNTQASLLNALYEEHHRWLFHWLCKKLRCRDDDSVVFKGLVTSTLPGAVYMKWIGRKQPVPVAQ